MIVVAYERDPAHAAKIQAAIGKAVGSDDKDKKSRKKVSNYSLNSKTLKGAEVTMSEASKIFAGEL